MVVVLCGDAEGPGTSHDPGAVRSTMIIVPVTCGEDPEPHTCLLVHLQPRAQHEPLLVLIPFPNPTGTTHLGVVDPATTRALFAEWGDPDDHGSDPTARRAAPARCIVAPTAAALLDVVDWSEFPAPPDAVARLSALQDPALTPPDCGFLVVVLAPAATATATVGIVMPGRHASFPTCREGNCIIHSFDDVCRGFNLVFPAAPTTHSADPAVLGRAHAACRALRATWQDTAEDTGMVPEPFVLQADMVLRGRFLNGTLEGQPIVGTASKRPPLTAPAPVCERAPGTPRPSPRPRLFTWGSAGSRSPGPGPSPSPSPSAAP